MSFLSIHAVAACCLCLYVNASQAANATPSPLFKCDSHSLDPRCPPDCANFPNDPRCPRPQQPAASAAQ
ncbi:hypothetical protein [Chromobacterium alticapitis]|uniref:Uncharacterized protein n=1 Tax=Chromobacterium alticapitis TaxID=2073169 RepID=A0A2S5DGH8_9NEIS|nr:hypothetical protein [Chromobacterium alticapitis]POZ62193.1 hypothetical protein C2I19_10270 [Chromobacterium alticapitis]